MTPTQLSSALRQIASKLSSPGISQEELNRSYKTLILLHDHVNVMGTMNKFPHGIAAMEEIEVSFWDGDDGTAVEDAYKAARREEEADRLESALKLLSRQVNRFIKEIQHPSLEHGDDSDVFTSAPPM